MTAKELWAQFCEKERIDSRTPYEAWAFCGGGPAADALAELVLERRKFGTSSAYDDYVAEGALDQLPKIGDYSVILRSDGEAVCVIRDYDVYIRPFGEVPPFHGYAEGEGDRSLSYWRQVHRGAFAPGLQEKGISWSDNSLIVCEKFTVEYVPGETQRNGKDGLVFAEPSMHYADEIKAYRQEMIEANSSFDGCLSLKRMPDIQEYVDYCRKWSVPARPEEAGAARIHVILCLRKSDGRMVGCMQVHSVLTERMKQYTGHIGYSVRPSERRKGYASRMLTKAKDFLSSFGLAEMIASCLPENEASRRTILAGGGEYIGTVHLAEDDVTLERYRIKL